MSPSSMNGSVGMDTGISGSTHRFAGGPSTAVPALGSPQRLTAPHPAPPPAPTLAASFQQYSPSIPQSVDAYSPAAATLSAALAATRPSHLQAQPLRLSQPSVLSHPLYDPSRSDVSTSPAAASVLLRHAAAQHAASSQALVTALAGIHAAEMGGGGRGAGDICVAQSSRGFPGADAGSSRDVAPFARGAAAHGSQGRGIDAAQARSAPALGVHDASGRSMGDTDSRSANAVSVVSGVLSRSASMPSGVATATTGRVAESSRSVAGAPFSEGTGALPSFTGQPHTQPLSQPLVPQPQPHEPARTQAQRISSAPALSASAPMPMPSLSASASAPPSASVWERPMPVPPPAASVWDRPITISPPAHPGVVWSGMQPPLGPIQEEGAPASLQVGNAGTGSRYTSRTSRDSAAASDVSSMPATASVLSSGSTRVYPSASAATGKIPGTGTGAYASGAEAVEKTLARLRELSGPDWPASGQAPSGPSASVLPGLGAVSSSSSSSSSSSASVPPFIPPLALPSSSPVPVPVAHKSTGTSNVPNASPNISRDSTASGLGSSSGSLPTTGSGAMSGGSGFDWIAQLGKGSVSIQHAAASEATAAVQDLISALQRI